MCDFTQVELAISDAKLKSIGGSWFAGFILHTYGRAVTKSGGK